MAQIRAPFKGIFEGYKEETAKNGNKYFVVFVKMAAYVDQFGDRKGEDTTFKLSALNSKWKAHEFDYLKGKKVEVVAFVNSFSYAKDGNVEYGVSLNLYSLGEYKEEKRPARTQETQTKIEDNSKPDPISDNQSAQGEEDDLPF